MVEPSTHRLEDDGTIPNNPRLPLLVYTGAFEKNVSAEQIRDRFQSNEWGGAWVNGVFSYHHFHSNAHEVLGCFGGSATIQFGGESGIQHDIKAGDVVVIPAGVGHKKISGDSSFGVVGAYPGGQDFDLCRNAEGDKNVRENIREVPVPKTDPLYGPGGPLIKIWSSENDS